MKDNAQELKDLLLEFGTFLEEQGEDYLSSELISMIDYVDVDLKEAKRIMRRWYGGMGSFQDLGIGSKDKDSLIEVNNKFDCYADKLYDLVSIYS